MGKFNLRIFIISIVLGFTIASSHELEKSNFLFANTQVFFISNNGNHNDYYKYSLQYDINIADVIDIEFHTGYLILGAERHNNPETTINEQLTEAGYRIQSDLFYYEGPLIGLGLRYYIPYILHKGLWINSSYTYTFGKLGDLSQEGIRLDNQRKYTPGYDQGHIIEFGFGYSYYLKNLYLEVSVTLNKTIIESGLQWESKTLPLPGIGIGYKF